MIHKTKVIQAISRFIKEDIAGKLKGSLKYWLFIAAAEIAIANANQIIDNFSQNEIAKQLNLVDGEMINVDAIIPHLRNAARQSTATVDLNLFGALTLDGNDVEKIYRYIKEA